MRIRVECYAGYRGEETPRRIFVGKRKIEIKDVQDRWLSPNHRYFKVHGDDNAVYILRHDPETEDWDLAVYSRADAASVSTSHDPSSRYLPYSIIEYRQAGLDLSGSDRQGGRKSDAVFTTP